MPDSYEHDCGPRAVHACLTLMGKNVPLTKVQEECKWTFGQEIQLSDLVSALNANPEVVAKLARPTWPNLIEHTRSFGPAILVLDASDSQHHAVACAHSDGKLAFYEFGKVVRNGDATLSPNDWSGLAILVKDSRDSGYSVVGIAFALVLMVTIVAFILKSVLLPQGEVE